MFQRELDSFFFKQNTLYVAANAESVGADLSFSVDHSLPGNVLSAGGSAQRSQGKADHLCRTAPDQTGDLAVTGYLAVRNLPYNGIDSFV